MSGSVTRSDCSRSRKSRTDKEISVSLSVLASCIDPVARCLPQVREITVEGASTASPMPRFCYPQTFTGVLMKSRLLSSTPQWRRMSYAVVQWK
jgi:hypothetical protein